MDNLTVVKTPAGWAERVADFVASANDTPENQIGYYGDDTSQIRHSLLTESPEIIGRSTVAVMGAEVVGFLGAEADSGVGRVWLFGPTVTHPEWDRVSDALIAELSPLLPSDAPEQELFFNVANARCARFGERHGFARYKDCEILRFQRKQVSDLPAGDAREVRDDESASLAALHDRLFPSAPWTGRQVMERRGRHEKVFVAEDAGPVVGYIHARVDPAFPEGNIEFVGVVETSRRRGVGTRLVASALKWMFSFDHIEVTWLTVMEDDPGARRLYVGLGWDPIHAMRSMRRSILS
ncbi:MAG: GNAT family N-acetyltransferase [Actinomycetota bacterium]